MNFIAGKLYRVIYHLYDLCNINSFRTHDLPEDTLICYLRTKDYHNGNLSYIFLYKDIQISIPGNKSSSFPKDLLEEVKY